MHPIQAFFAAFAAHPVWSTVLVGAGLSLVNLVTSHVMGRPKLRALGLDYDGEATNYDGPNLDGIFCGLQWLWAAGGLIAACAEIFDGASYLVPGMSGVVAEVVASGALAYGLVLTAILGIPNIYSVWRASREASELEAQRSNGAIMTRCQTLADHALEALLPGNKEFFAPLVARALDALRVALEVRDKMEARGAFDATRVAAKADALHPGKDAALPGTAREFLQSIETQGRVRKVTLGDIRVLVEEIEAFFEALDDALLSLSPSAIEAEVTGLCERVRHFGVAVADPQIALPARDPELAGINLDDLELDPANRGRPRQAN